MLTPEQFLHNLKSPNIRKEARYDNEILADWNRKQPCAICGHEPAENSHTLKKKRSGNNGSQVYALPLCREHHSEYENVSIEDYLKIHPNLFEIVTRNIEKWATEFTAIREIGEKHLKKAKVSQPKKQESIFKKSRSKLSKRETCQHCFMKSFPDDAVRHSPECREFAPTDAQGEQTAPKIG